MKNMNLSQKSYLYYSGLNLFYITIVLYNVLLPPEHSLEQIFIK